MYLVHFSKQISHLKSQSPIPPLHIQEQDSESSSQSSRRSPLRENVFCDNCLQSSRSNVSHNDEFSPKHWESKYSHVILENENLRSGMFEILEKIQEVDGKYI